MNVVCQSRFIVRRGRNLALPGPVLAKKMAWPSLRHSQLSNNMIYTRVT